MPRPHVSLPQALKNWFKYMFHFSGRASRSEFWWAYLVSSLVVIALVSIWFIVMLNLSAPLFQAQEDYILGNISQSEYEAVVADSEGKRIMSILLLSLISLVAYASLLSLFWRRLHDAGFSGLLTLLVLVGLGIVPLIMCALPSKPEGARFDKPIDAERP